MGPYTGADYNLPLCRHIYHGQPCARVDLNPKQYRVDFVCRRVIFYTIWSCLEKCCNFGSSWVLTRWSMHCFKCRITLFRAPPVALTSILKAYEWKNTAISTGKSIHVFSAGNFTNFGHQIPWIQIRIDLKCWIRIRNEANADSQHWLGQQQISSDPRKNLNLKNLFLSHICINSSQKSRARDPFSFDLKHL